VGAKIANQLNFSKYQLKMQRAKNFKESDVLARISSLDITGGPCSACDNEAVAMDIADKSPEWAYRYHHLMRCRPIPVWK